eukprot:TRINITY_DN3720_c0_g1_i3.p1 TRINITY_DN3720_c0_g1~~TRINITY_DN3720_c0_g1_i3.p1  ORF type:complete len:240 (-),score=33.19 TRINITY_DN3720_c0_g1_i3:73-735(-)
MADFSIDALAYIDTQYSEDPELRNEVDTLVAEEMKKFRAPDYLARFPLPETNFLDSIFLQSEYERIMQGRPQTSIDMSHHKVEEPSGDRKDDLAAWKQTVRNAHIQIEYKAIQGDALEALKQSSAEDWKSGNLELEGSLKQLEQFLQKYKADIDAVNRKRKIDQTSNAPTLVSLERQWHELVQKNNEIETACYMLERENKRTRASRPQPTENDIVDDSNE